jgi:hypothetical protein
LQQAEGLLDRDRGILRQARMDLERYQQAYARHAVAKQILDDQEQAVTQYEGVVKSDMGQVSYAQLQPELLPHCGARERKGGSATGRYRKHHLCRQRQSVGRTHTTAADNGRF